MLFFGWLALVSAHRAVSSSGSHPATWINQSGSKHNSDISASDLFPTWALPIYSTPTPQEVYQANLKLKYIWNKAFSHAFRSFSTLFFLLSLMFAGCNLVLFFFVRSLAFAANNLIQVCHFLHNAQQWQKSQTDHYHLFSVSFFPPVAWSTVRVKKNFSEITKLIFFLDTQLPSSRLSTLRAQNGKHKKTCNTRLTVVQQVQRQAGRIVSGGLGTLDSPYALLSGRTTLTAEFHFTGVRDGA